MNLRVGVSIILVCCICSTEPTTINCIDNRCGDYYNDSGLKCCQYENLTSDVFVYSDVNLNSMMVSLKYSKYAKRSLDIEQFVIVNSNVSKIPEHLFENIIQLKQLDMVNSGLRLISINDFRGADHLIHLNLTRNAIQSLEPKLFIHAQNLVVLDLSFNAITNLVDYAFDHLDMLKTLILSHNKIMAFDVKQSSFINLEVFAINDNFLNAIGQEIFQNSSKLREINLRNNNLRIERLVLPSNVTLDTFDISNNLVSITINSKRISIQNTSTTSYLVHNAVEVLDASHNQISNIQFESNAHVMHVNLSNNHLTSVKNITCLHNIQLLDLSSNAIKDFAISSFSEMNDLRVLNLRKSGLTSLDFGTFSQQTKLIFLDISDNNLKKINFDMLLFMSSLAVLYIDGNQLTIIDVSDIKNILPKLTTISISRNLFHCHHLVSIMKILSSLRIDLRSVDAVKNRSNIRGIKCFSDSNERNSIEIRTVESKNNLTSDVHLQKEMNDLDENEMFDLKNSFETMKSQFETRFIEQMQNLSSLNEKFMSYSTHQNRLVHGNDSDSFQFAFTFLLIIVILFAFGLSLFLYCKLRARRRWYTATKQNSTSADQTLV